MGQIGVAITNLPTVIFLKKPFSDGLGGGRIPPLRTLSKKQLRRMGAKMDPIEDALF
jgi:hypothetical protein